MALRTSPRRALPQGRPPPPPRPRPRPPQPPGPGPNGPPPPGPYGPPPKNHILFGPPGPTWIGPGISPGPIHWPTNFARPRPRRPRAHSGPSSNRSWECISLYLRSCRHRTPANAITISRYIGKRRRNGPGAVRGSRRRGGPRRVGAGVPGIWVRFIDLGAVVSSGCALTRVLPRNATRTGHCTQLAASGRDKTTRRVEITHTHYGE
jgi:hypothetical protein